MERRCFRCMGRKKMYRINSIYSMTNTGGEEVTCPLCNGTGRIKDLEETVKEIEELKIKLDVQKEKENEIKKTEEKKPESEKITDKIKTLERQVDFVYEGKENRSKKVK